MPGLFLTDISKAWDLEASEERAKTAGPLQRGGQPDEVVGTALCRVSATSSFTTGDPGLDGGAHAELLVETATYVITRACLSIGDVAPFRGDNLQDSISGGGSGSDAARGL